MNCEIGLIDSYTSICDGDVGLVRCISLFGNGEEQVFAAVVEDATSTERIYIIRTCDGECIASISSHFGNFLHAIDIEFDQTGNLFVCDYETKNIQIFDNVGLYKHWLNTSSDVKEPRGMSIGKDDSILVYDNEDQCVKVFNSQGNLVNIFGNDHLGYQDPEPDLCGISVHIDSGTIGVIDKVNTRVLLFDCDYNLIMCMSNPDFNHISDISFGEQYKIFVCNWSNDCIYIVDKEKTRIIHIKQPHTLVVNDMGGIFLGSLSDNHVKYLILNE